jgi:hypothetical protein
VEIFKTSNFEGYSGMLVFFGFMPAGAPFLARSRASPSRAGRPGQEIAIDGRIAEAVMSEFTAFVRKTPCCLLKPSANSATNS